MGYSLFVIACCPKIHAPSLLKRLVKEPVQFWTKNNAKKKKKKIVLKKIYGGKLFIGACLMG